MCVCVERSTDDDSECWLKGKTQVPEDDHSSLHRSRSEHIHTRQYFVPPLPPSSRPPVITGGAGGRGW